MTEGVPGMLGFLSPRFAAEVGPVPVLALAGFLVFAGAALATLWRRMRAVRPEDAERDRHRDGGGVRGVRRGGAGHAGRHPARHRAG